YSELFTLSGSVIPAVVLPSFLLTLWGSLWTCLYEIQGYKWVSIASTPITVLGVVMGLLLVFRTNTAYDRYWEGRRLWGTLVTQIRNLSRFVWVGTLVQTEHHILEKKGCMNLLLAFAFATKHYLRDEHGSSYNDLHSLLTHLPDFKPGAPHPNILNMPLEISYHISSFIASSRLANLIEAPQESAMMASLSSMIDCLTSFERIRNTPIPLAYSIHLKQTLMLYILTIPFQLVGPLGWGTIPIMFIASFTLLGIEGIGGEIEDPFGYDENDLPLLEFCDSLREEINKVMTRPSSLDPATWGAP
ncbi:Bestrophin/UPF0187, partial [Blyttiomyces helicus]